MVGKARKNDAFENFRNEIELGNWSVAGQFIMRKRMFFMKRSDNSGLKCVREDAI